MKKGIIFDLDGTLWDSLDHVVESWNDVMRREGYDKQITRGELVKQVGKPMDVIMAEMAPEIPLDERTRLMDVCVSDENEYVAVHGGVLYPGLEDALAELRGKYPLFIVSNCQAGYIEAFFTAHKLQNYFADYECWGNTGLSKGENIRMVMGRNRLHRAVYIGDTAGDESAARDAGIPFVFASYGFGEAAAPDAAVSSLSELPAIVGKLFGKRRRMKKP